MSFDSWGNLKINHRSAVNPNSTAYTKLGDGFMVISTGSSDGSVLIGGDSSVGIQLGDGYFLANRDSFNTSAAFVSFSPSSFLVPMQDSGSSCIFVGKFGYGTTYKSKKTYGIDMNIRGDSPRGKEEYFRIHNPELQYDGITEPMILTLDETGKQKNMTVAELKTLLGIS
jgi:hypothetical protein